MGRVSFRIFVIEERFEYHADIKLSGTFSRKSTKSCVHYIIFTHHSELHFELKNSPIKRLERETITTHKIYQMEREIQSLRTENEIFKRSGCGLISSLDEKIAAIEQLKNDFSIYVICKTLNILRSTYYHRVLRSPEKTQYEIADEKLRPLIKEIFVKSRGQADFLLTLYCKKF